MSATTIEQSKVVAVPPALAAEWIAKGTARLVDVREDFEHAAERIVGSECCALSGFDESALRSRFAGQRVVFYCRSGKRAAEAAQRFQSGGDPVFCIAGGMQAWKDAGLATEVPAAAPRVDVMRQTQMVIGSFVLAGTLLGAFVSPWFLLLSGFMGAGLLFAGASGTCGMASLLGRMPWNRVSASCARAG